MSTLEEESARRAGLAGAKNNTRGALDRPGTRLLRLRPTLSHTGSPEGSAPWSSAPWSRLIGCSLLLFLWRRRVAIETMTPHEYASHSPAMAARLLACITAHST